MVLALYRRNGSKNTLWIGPSKIEGIFRINGVPQSREIFLLEMDGLTVVRKTFSDNNGNYSFTGLPLGVQWLLLYIDSTGQYNAVARSHVESSVPSYIPTPTTWDLTFNTNLTYSQNDFSVNSVHYANSFARTIFGATSGEYYIELSNLNIYSMVGVVTSDLPKTTSYVGANPGELAIYANNANVYREDVVIGTEVSNFPLTTIGIHLDASARSVKFITNSNSANPTVYGPIPGTEPIHIAFASGASTTSSCLLNTGQLPFVYTKPTGANSIFG